MRFGEIKTCPTSRYSCRESDGTRFLRTGLHTDKINENMDRLKMFGDRDEYSVFDRLWEMISNKFAFSKRFAFIVPLRIIRRPESLTILDYRPTLFMFLTGAGFVFMAVLFALFFFRFDTVDSLGLWLTGIPAAVCLILSFRGTIREAYYFDNTKDSYAFVRQFIHRREVIEGSLSQFTGAYVQTKKVNSQDNYDSESYFVVLKQEGMFLTGVSEQMLREEVPIFNSFEREARIASAISGILPSKR